jgi:signal transduction histidine kinase
VARGDGRVALLNPAAVRLLGLELGPGEAGSLVGRTVEASIPQHTLQRLLSGPLLPAERIQADEARAGESRAVPIEIQTRRGVIHLLARASDVVLAEPGENTSGGALGRVVVMTDITELQRTIQMRTDFVANASHELRTPLSTIRAAVETLLSMDLQAEAPAARQFLAKLDRQSQRLEQMVSDLLDLSRLESPTARFTPEPVECRRALTELHGRFADALSRKSLEWESRVEPEGLTTIMVNPQLLRLVLDNLVDNAIKFTDPGGRVGVVLRRTNGDAELEVSDSGCGIPAEEQERVFERFYQVQRARTGGADRGTGLGLSIVRHAVGAMGATVRLRSAVGRGTTVTVVAPQQPAARE